MTLLLFYPWCDQGGLFILVGRILGGFFVFELVLIGVLELAGELDVAWWIVAVCGVLGALSPAKFVFEIFEHLLDPRRDRKSELDPCLAK